MEVTELEDVDHRTKWEFLKAAIRLQCNRKRERIKKEMARDFYLEKKVKVLADKVSQDPTNVDLQKEL